MSSISITLSTFGLVSCLLLFSTLRLAGNSGSLPTITLNSLMYNIQLFCIVCKYLLCTFRPFIELLYAPQKPRRQYSALSRPLNDKFSKLPTGMYNTQATHTCICRFKFRGVQLVLELLERRGSVPNHPIAMQQVGLGMRKVCLYCTCTSAITPLTIDFIIYSSIVQTP